ncbi:MAG TPA: glutathione S-transferase family protein [Burkholderiales bacterium]|nr:glutathione S-transferase family protein [Burkholderiales bacterium]
MLQLVIGDKNYSSWSMRPWVLLTQAGIAFEEIQVWLREPDTKANIARYSPSGTVPVLIDDDLKVHDSLAICEYLAEKFPEKSLWPRDTAQRARARSVSAEMHSSFNGLRGRMPMNIRNRYLGRGMNEEVAADVVRLSAMWGECLARSGGPWLFGEFGIADAMYTPMVFRLQTYGVALQGAALQYLDTMLATPALVKLAAQAAVEPHPLASYDQIYP